MGALRWVLGFYARLPRAFSCSFPLLLGATSFLAGHAMTHLEHEDLDRYLHGSALEAAWGHVPVFARVVGEGLLFMVLLLAALLLAYDLAAALAGMVCRKEPFPVDAAELDPPAPPPTEEGPLAGKRIGIVLAGGGAKGVYQAGALKAIHEFLAEHGALGQVQAVSGTSIGSWNALCWVAGLLGSRAGEPSPHERWWKTTPMRRVVAPALYRPLQNYIFTSAPWRQHYDAIFADNPAVRERLHALGRGGAVPHLYLTRSNVRRAELEFSTNRPRPGDHHRGWRRGHSVAGLDPEATLAAWKEAVYASMDLPPAFPFTTLAREPGEVFEDGGVVDNLPTRFVTFHDECDLVFVLPLNATFESEPSRSSILARLLRVLNVRQGELERRSMYLLQGRNELRRARGEPALAVFAVCPDQPLAVNTLDFGTADIAPSFDRMYEATRALLRDELPRCLAGEEIRLFCVGPAGREVRTETFEPIGTPGPRGS